MGDVIAQTEVVHLRRICSWCGREATDPRDIADGVVPIGEARRLMRCARCRCVSYCPVVQPGSAIESRALAMRQWIY